MPHRSASDFCLGPGPCSCGAFLPSQSLEWSDGHLTGPTTGPPAAPGPPSTAPRRGHGAGRAGPAGLTSFRMLNLTGCLWRRATGWHGWWPPPSWALLPLRVGASPCRARPIGCGGVECEGDGPVAAATSSRRDSTHPPPRPPRRVTPPRHARRLPQVGGLGEVAAGRTVAGVGVATGGPQSGALVQPPPVGDNRGGGVTGGPTLAPAPAPPSLSTPPHHHLSWAALPAPRRTAGGGTPAPLARPSTAAGERGGGSFECCGEEEGAWPFGGRARGLAGGVGWRGAVRWRGACRREWGGTPAPHPAASTRSVRGHGGARPPAASVRLLTCCRRRTWSLSGGDGVPDPHGAAAGVWVVGSGRDAAVACAPTRRGGVWAVCDTGPSTPCAAVPLPRKRLVSPAGRRCRRCRRRRRCRRHSPHRYLWLSCTWHAGLPASRWHQHSVPARHLPHTRAPLSPGGFLARGVRSVLAYRGNFSSSVLLWCAHPPHLPLFLCLGGLVVRCLVFVAVGLPWRAGGALLVGCLGGGVRLWWGNRFMVVFVAFVSCHPPRRRNSLLGGRAIRSALPRALLGDLGVPGVLWPLLYVLPPLEETAARSRPFWLLLIDRRYRRGGLCDRGVAAALRDEYG